MAENYVLKQGEEFPKGLRLAQDIACTLSERPGDVLLQGPVIGFSNGYIDFNGVGRSIEEAVQDLKRKMYEEFNKWRHNSSLPYINPKMRELSLKLGELFGLTEEQVFI